MLRSVSVDKEKESRNVKKKRGRERKKNHLVIWCLQFHYRVLLFNRCFLLKMMFEVKTFSFRCARVAC